MSENRSVYLAIDCGEKVIGLALFRSSIDPYPTPYGRIVTREGAVFERLIEIIKDESVDHLIIGLPYYADGKISEVGEKIQKFTQSLVEQLKNNDLNLAHTFQAEDLSSQEAKDRMLNSPRYHFSIDLKEIDALSASIILERYLNSHA